MSAAILAVAIIGLIAGGFAVLGFFAWLWDPYGEQADARRRNR